MKKYTLLLITCLLISLWIVEGCAHSKLDREIAILEKETPADDLHRARVYYKALLKALIDRD